MLANTVSITAARKGCLIQGVGYIIPERNILYDETGNRIKRVSEVTRSVVNGSSGIKMSGQDVRRCVYHDPSVMCDERELIDFGLVGEPLCINHDAGKRIGEIVNASVHDGKLLITASVTDPHWAKKIADDNFDLKSFSVSYSVKVEDDMVVSKKFTEISMVDEPFYDNCDLEIYASDTAASDRLTIYSDAMGTSLNVCASETGATDTVSTPPPENAMDTEDIVGVGDNANAQDTNEQHARVDDTMIQEDEGQNGDNRFGNDAAGGLSMQELQERLEMMTKKQEETQRLLDERTPQAQRFQEEREKLADSLTKTFLELDGGLNDENRAGAEEFAKSMRELAKRGDNSLDFMAKSLKAAKQSASATTQQKTAPSVKIPQIPSNQQPKTTTPQRPIPKVNPSPASPASSRPAPSSSSSHRPVVDWTSGQTKTVPSVQSGVKRTILSEIFPDESQSKKYKSAVAVSAGKNTERTHVSDPEKIVYMSPAFSEFWTSAMVMPILDRSAGSGDLFNRKSQTSSFGFGNNNNNGGNTLMVAASRSAHGEIGDHPGGRGIMPTFARCHKSLGVSRDFDMQRKKIMNGFFPDNVHQETLSDQLGGALDWNQSLHLFESSDENMRRVIEHPELGGNYECVGMSGNLAIAASKDPVGLNISGTPIEKSIAKARSVSYFSSFSEAQLLTLATVSATDYLGICLQQQTVNT